VVLCGSPSLLQEVGDLPRTRIAVPRGDNGPLPIIDLQNPSVVSHAFVEAAVELGATEKYNYFNGASQETGVGFYQSTCTVDGIRAAASAFAKPVLGRENLRLLLQVRATRSVIEQEQVRGIEYVGTDGVVTIRPNAKSSCAVAPSRHRS
jgi:choline dehydrogenase